MTDQRAGWELIWQSKEIPARYQSLAAPNDTVIEWAATLPAGGTILDIGCGVGRHCLYMGQQGFQVAGTDISPTAIETTAALCEEHGIPFDGQVADMMALPWEDNIFDGALSISTINHHLRANIGKTLDEVLRVLKPGGLFLVDFLSTGMEDYQKLREQVAAGEISEPEQDTFVDKRPNIDPLDDSFLPHHYCTEDDLRDLMKSFEIVKLWTGRRDSGKTGKWVVWARKPIKG